MDKLSFGKALSGSVKSLQVKLKEKVSSSRSSSQSASVSGSEDFELKTDDNSDAECNHSYSVGGGTRLRPHPIGSLHSDIQGPIASSAPSAVSTHVSSDNLQSVASALKSAPVGDSVAAKKATSKVQRKEIIWLRHARSLWNEVASRESAESGGSSLAYVRQGFDKLSMLSKGWIESKMDSANAHSTVIFDAPLSDAGILECFDFVNFISLDNTLRKNAMSDMSVSGVSQESAISGFPTYGSLSRERVLATLRGDNIRDSMIVTSNLRRAIDTCLICMSPRLLKPKNREPVYICSALQEFGVAPDTHSATAALQKPDISRHLRQNPRVDTAAIDYFYRQRLDTTFNTGPKHLRKKQKTPKLDRMLAFCELVFSEANAERSAVVVCGHSHWLRHFFETFLPKNYALKDSHVATRRKVYNCGVVSFQFCRVFKDGRILYGINPETVKTIYKGFET